RLSPTLYHSAQLYKGKATPKALSRGTLDMGVPGVWQLSSYDTNADITSLPRFYGQSPKAARILVDGEWGRKLSQSLEKKMRVKVLGKFYELGYLHTFMVTKPITKLDDFKGLKIRYPAAPVHALRIKALGASPMMIPFADVPMALLQGTVDGLLTSFKTADGVKLDESGMKYATKDYWALLHYAPMVSQKFWNSLPKDLQKIMKEVWNEHVDDERRIAVKMQDEAEAALEKRGVKIYRPDEQQRAKWRQHILPSQEAFVRKMKMDVNLVNRAKEILGMK
ncbi:MAG: TRAP transporter substrate-binding protein DctP, partial [Deltaproteobacteria bacterium]|nr:TRAP transporter substrate-binding protein DctP [Deltaproteobacteria bacterium]